MGIDSTTSEVVASIKWKSRDITCVHEIIQHIRNIYKLKQMYRRYDETTRSFDPMTSNFNHWCLQPDGKADASQLRVIYAPLKCTAITHEVGVVPVRAENRKIVTTYVVTALDKCARAIADDIEVVNIAAFALFYLI